MLRKRLGWFRRSGRRALGAISGQLSQALASVVLQILVTRTMGAGGLGIFAVLYGAIVFGTAITTGMVGDSLTVLDRADPRLRAALVRWCLLLSTAAGAIAAVLTALFSSLSPATSILFGLAAVVFLIEDALRRMLMATLRFWSLPMVDFTSLVFSLLTLLVVHLSHADLTMSSFMLALFVGQVAASVLAYFRLPNTERHISPRGNAAMREVFNYGAWRSVQVSVRPATLTASRLVITAIAGIAAYGKLEAARVYMAPALLVISGMGSFLLPMYVAQRDQALSKAMRRADRATVGLLTSTMALGVLGTLAVPALGGVITGNRFSIAPLAVLGWAVYAASGAGLLPYTGLAAVRGKQNVLTAIRLLDPVLSLSLLAIVTSVVVVGAPYAIAVGSMLAGIAVRRWVLRPLAVAEAGRPQRGRHRADRSRPQLVTAGRHQVATDTNGIR